MNCKNCGGSGGKKGNQHVRAGRFTCTRRSNSGATLPDVSLGGLTSWVSSDESTGNSYTSNDNSSYSSDY